MTAKELKRTLQDLRLRDMVVDVEEEGLGHLVATVSSPDFNDQDEGERQQRVWEHLIEALPDEDRAQVEFVFTLTPEELRHPSG